MQTHKPTHPSTRSAATLSAALASVITLTACGTAPNGGTSTESTDEAVTRAAPASGVDVFKGVIFGSGPVATKLSMWSPEMRAQAAATPAPVKIAQLESALTQMRADGWSAEAIAHTEKTLNLLRQGVPLPQVDAATRAQKEDYVVEQLAKTDPSFLQRFGVEMQSGNPVRVDAAFKEAQSLLKAMAPHRTGVSERGGDDDGGPVFIYIFVVIVAFIEAVSEPDTRLGNDKLVIQLADELQAQ
jgi:hypothetical protein